MITRRQTGSLKPKLPFTGYSTLFLPIEVPPNVSVALANPVWKQVMQDEFDALTKNQTWILVPLSSSMNIVGLKWVLTLQGTTSCARIPSNTWS